MLSVYGVFLDVGMGQSHKPQAPPLRSHTLLVILSLDLRRTLAAMELHVGLCILLERIFVVPLNSFFEC